VQRKHLEVLKKKVTDGQGKQREFRNVNESIMMSVISVMSSAPRPFKGK
jgi:hypothetical protein